MGDKAIRILLVEDNPGDARLIRELLAEDGAGRFDLQWADCLTEGLRRLAGPGFDLVLLDLSLPESRGLATLAAVVAQAPRVPTIVLTGLDDEATAVEAMRSGAQDYLVKGQIDARLLGRAARYAVERKRIGEALQDANRRLEALATTDGLTGLLNRRRFLEVLDQEFHRARRYGAPLALAMLDVDRFKTLNDTHGHAFGDAALKQTAEALRQEARQTDFVARYGGEEFMVLMPATPADHAAAAAERIRRRIADSPVTDGRQSAAVTVSAGIADADDADSPDALLRRAGCVVGMSRWLLANVGTPEGPYPRQGLTEGGGRAAKQVFFFF